MEPKSLEVPSFIIEGKSMSQNENLMRIKEYMSKIGKSTEKYWSSIVNNRRIVVSLLEQALEQHSIGEDTDEKIILQLLMPTYDKPDELPSQEYSNLWLIDERLAFNTLMNTGKTLIEYPSDPIDSNPEPESNEPGFYERPMLVHNCMTSGFSELNVVLFKHPFKDPGDCIGRNNPIDMVLFYLDKVRTGKCSDYKGDPIIVPDKVPSFCHIVCNLTPSIVRRCWFAGCLNAMRGELGYYGYHRNYDTYLQVLSYDALVQLSKERLGGNWHKLKKELSLQNCLKDEEERRVKLVRQSVIKDEDSFKKKLISVWN